MNLLEHARIEFMKAGYNVDKDTYTKNDYFDDCAKCVYDLLELLEKQGLSNTSRNIVLSLFNKLAQYKTLSPLTNNQDEWTNISSLSQVC